MIQLNKEELDYKEMVNLIEKPWVDVYSIMKLAQCGKYSATRIRTEIEEMIVAEGKRIPSSCRKRVPTKLLLDYLGLDVDYIYTMASRAS